jgi:hypothetical protein
MIFGRRITKADIAWVVVIVLGFQLLCTLGLDWLFNL